MGCGTYIQLILIIVKVLCKPSKTVKYEKSNIMIHDLIPIFLKTRLYKKTRLK